MTDKVRPSSTEDVQEYMATVDRLRTQIAQLHEELSALVQSHGTVKKRLEELNKVAASLDLAYREAGHDLSKNVIDDLAFIRGARREAAKITTILRGTELFGRYAQDADHHYRVANRWRLGAVIVALAYPFMALFLIKVLDLNATGVASVMASALLLFFYASVESFNHRRREFDRRRIALRVSAIEAFTKSRREGGDSSSRKTAEALLDEFVRKHFIQPELDSNDMTYPGPRFSLITLFQRKLPPSSDVDAAPMKGK